MRASLGEGASGASGCRNVLSGWREWNIFEKALLARTFIAVDIRLRMVTLKRWLGASRAMGSDFEIVREIIQLSSPNSRGRASGLAAMWGQ